MLIFVWPRHFYLKEIGELRGCHIAIAVVALVLLLVPIVGTVYPAPPPPQNYFSYIFISYLVAGVILVSLLPTAASSNSRESEEVLEEVTMGSAGQPALAKTLLMDPPPISAASDFQDRNSMAAFLIGSIARRPPLPVKSRVGRRSQRGLPYRAWSLWRSRLCLVRRRNRESGKCQESPEVARHVPSSPCLRCRPPAARSEVPAGSGSRAPEQDTAVSIQPRFCGKALSEQKLGRAVELLTAPAAASTSWRSSAQPDRSRSRRR